MRILFLTLLCLASSTSFGQTAPERTSRQVTKYLREFSSVIKKNALYADSINWKELEVKVSNLSKGMRSIEDCKPVIDTIMFSLRKAGDKHSGFLDKQAAQKFTSSNYASIPVESRYLDDDIGYIKVPMFASMDLSASENFASEIQNCIRQLDETHNIKGWIVDLRGNNGGNMHPMIKGLSSLIGDGVYGYVLYPKQAVALSMESGQTAFIKLKSSYRIKNYNKIALLIDSSTASSGEFTAIAFMTLPNVLLFGQPSAGYTTSNQTFRLSDDSYLYLATAYMADRKGNKYLPNIVPDVILPSKPNMDIDPVIDAARNWLLSR